MSPLTQVACPGCRTGNRIAPGRDPRTATCGQCGAHLVTSAPIDVDDQAFAKHMANTKGLIVLDVWAQWCGPCRMMALHFADAADKLAGSAIFLKMDADRCQAPGKLGVRGIPALFIFENGIIIARHAGLMTADGLLQWIQSSRRTP